MSALEVKNLSKCYQGKIQALKNVSISAPESSIYGLLGPNGSGKTTLIKAVLDIIHKDQGEIRVFGQDHLNPSCRSLIGYLPENHKYPLFLSGEEVLFYFGGMSGLKDSELKSKIPTILSLVDMKDWGKTKIKKYSKGMLQRIGLAQALMTDPKLLFLDEPTDGIDPIGRKEIHEILLRLKNEGKTVFINSHMLAEIESVCDRVAILRKGELIRSGTVSEITTNMERFIIELEYPISSMTAIFDKAPWPYFSESDYTFAVQIKHSDELNAIIDFLRANQVAIITINRQKESLEDSFIKAVKEESRI